MSVVREMACVCRSSRVGPLLVVMLLCATTRAVDSPTAILVDGQTLSAELVSLVADRQLTLQTGGQLRSLPLADLVSWRSRRAELPRCGVLFVDGGFLALQHAADVVTFVDQRLEVVSPLWGNVELPWDQVRGVLVLPPATARQQRQLRDQLATAQGTADQLWLENGDRLQGELMSLADGTLDFRLSGRAVTLELDQVQALLPSPARRTSRRPEAPCTLIGFGDGSQLRAESAEIGPERLIVSGTNGVVLRSDPQLARPAAQHVSLLQPLGGPVVYLSDLEPLDYLHLPFLSIPWSYGRDRNVLGGELQVAGTSYAKGLGMHSTARLAYTLDGAYERFESQLAIDDAAGQGGSVVFRVLVDRGGRWDSEFQSPIVRGGDAPQPCSVNLQGAARLALVVDFADRADQQDHADWLDARLIRAP